MKKILIPVLALLGASAALAQTVVYDTNTSTFSGWIVGAITTNNGSSLVTSTAGTGAAMFYLPSTETLVNPGDYLDLTVDFNLASGAGVSSSRSFYVTLQDSNGNAHVTSAAGNGLTDASFDTYTGYGAILNPAPSSSSVGQFDARTGAITSAIVGSTTPWVTPAGVGAMPSGTSVLTTANNYEINYQITLLAGSAVQFNYTLTNLTTATTLESQTATSSTGLTGRSLVTAFDTVALGINATQAGGASYDFTRVDLTTEAVPEPATYALIGGVFALGFAAFRRRSAKQKVA